MAGSDDACPAAPGDTARVGKGARKGGRRPRVVARDAQRTHEASAQVRVVGDGDGGTDALPHTQSVSQ
jgi:hypothetical protein